MIAAQGDEYRVVGESVRKRRVIAVKVKSLDPGPEVKGRHSSSKHRATPPPASEQRHARPRTIRFLGVKDTPALCNERSWICPLLLH